jgi:photosystem II stability/assembly factor-like uncharacterized protein
MTCTADAPCPVYLELASLEAPGGRLVAAGNLHTQSATLHSILLASEDGGKTWMEAHPNIRYASLDQAQFIDATNGWIAGQINGSIPREPFFLLTTDGGKSWKQRPVFSEARPGWVEKFQFTSAAQGRVLVNRAQSGEGGRFALLETMTGGDSWSIQQITTTPPKVNFERAPNASWRLQTNAANKTYVVEKREGSTWVAAASFLITAGACRPKELELNPPPEPTTPASAAAVSDAVEVFQIGGPRKKQETKKKKQ